MQHFQKISEGIDVAPALAQLEAHPELWNAHPERTFAGSPHYGIPDIWVRFRDKSELTETRHYGEPHFAVFYDAWHKIPALKPIVFSLMAKVGAVYMGGILITKIPPGKSVRPHNDRGSWHPEFHNCKVYVPLQANDGCVNICEDESAVMRPGEAWTFNNLVTHSVENTGATDRITLICCFRVEP